MDLIDRLNALATGLNSQSDYVKTEEAVKNAFIMPFMAALGYDPFDPTEVIPEMVADHGVKKGEKVDYAVKLEDKIVMLIECKQVGAPLEAKHVSQLYRYFSVTEAKFGVLTDGARYLFYTDLDTPNVMDARPFFEFNVKDFELSEVEYLKKFSKSSFDATSISGAASEMRNLKALRDELQNEWMSPSEEFVRVLFSRIVPGGRFTAQARESFTSLTSRAIEENLRGMINERLDAAAAFHSQKGAVAPAHKPVGREEAASVDDHESLPRIVTTPDEEGAFRMIQTIAAEVTEPDDITIRDGQVYCAILFKDNNRRPVARLYFNRKKSLQVGFFIGGEEQKIKIQRITELTQHREQIIRAVRQYSDP